MICQRCGDHRAEWYDDVTMTIMCEDCAVRAARDKLEDMDEGDLCELVGFEWCGDEDD